MDIVHHHASKGQPAGRWKWALAVAFLATVAFTLWTEHRAYLLGALPFLLILACPLLHLFHHHGHGNGSHRDAADDHAEEPRQAGRS